MTCVSRGRTKNGRRARNASRPETVLEALRIPKTGRVYDLGLELNDAIPSNSGLHALEPGLHPHAGRNRRAVALPVLGRHIQRRTSYRHPYGCLHPRPGGRPHIRWRSGAAMREPTRGWKQFGMETVRADGGARRPPRYSRRCKGRKRLDDGYEITVADLKAELARTGETIRDGRYRSRAHRQDPGLGKSIGLSGGRAGGRTRGGHLALRFRHGGARHRHDRHRAVAVRRRGCHDAPRDAGRPRCSPPRKPQPRRAGP